MEVDDHMKDIDGRFIIEDDVLSENEDRLCDAKRHVGDGSEGGQSRWMLLEALGDIASLFIR